MKKFEKFLFFYSILITTVILISFGLMSPKPLNLISIASFSPVVFYLWVRFTSPQAVDAEKWSLRFLLVLLVLSSLGIYGFYLARSLEVDPNETALRNQLMEMQKENEELSQKLEKVSTESAVMDTKKEVRDPSVEGESIADLLIESSPAPGTVQKITSKTGTTIDVYQSPNVSSKKVGSLEPKVNYPYLEKSDGWYKVVVTSTTNGWVSSSQVQEVY